MNSTPLSCLDCTHAMTRRQWFRRVAMSSAVYAAVSGASVATAINTAELLRMDVNAFPDLALPNSSIFITFNGGTTVILINRESPTDFYALNPRCTHAGCRVNPFSIATNTILCPCHSSQYDIAGHVVNGPALANLETYVTRFEGDSTLIIEVPGLVLRMDNIALESASGTGMRMRLTFPTMAGSQYHIRYAPDLESPFEIIAFATTAAGPANQSTLTGNGASNSVFVDCSGSAGFFVLELLILQSA